MILRLDCVPNEMRLTRTRKGGDKTKLPPAAVLDSPRTCQDSIQTTKMTQANQQLDVSTFQKCDILHHFFFVMSTTRRGDSNENPSMKLTHRIRVWHLQRRYSRNQRGQGPVGSLCNIIIRHMKDRRTNTNWEFDKV